MIYAIHACPHELTILAVADWPDIAERAIHNRLAQFAVRGEWFKDSPETQQVIQWMVGNNLNALRLQSIQGRNASDKGWREAIFPRARAEALERKRQAREVFAPMALEEVDPRAMLPTSFQSWRVYRFRHNRDAAVAQVRRREFDLGRVALPAAA